MQQMLRQRRLHRWMDDLGLRALIMALAWGWFVLLWGLGVPAMAAGTALGLLGQLAVSRHRRESAVAREAALRRRIGGTLVLEEMTLGSQAAADREAAALLTHGYPGLTAVRQADRGVVCHYGGETLLVRCIARPEQAEVALTDIAQAVRACREEQTDRAVLCACCRCPGAALAYAETLPTPVRLVQRERLLQLAGAMHPVTDPQLVALGARHKPLTPADVARGALRSVKARRYMTYGLALMLLYVVTGLKYYPIPGTICMLLAVGSRCVQEEPDRL